LRPPESLPKVHRTLPGWCWIGSDCFATEQRKQRGEQPTWLFYIVVEPPEHRISAGEEMSMADNSLLKTAKTAKTANPARRPPTPPGARCECV
jgi:hypothetical protein